MIRGKDRDRGHEIHAIVAGRYCGKSTLIAREIIPQYDAGKGKPQTVVILTNTDPPAYNKYRRIDSVEDMKRVRGVVKFYDRNFSMDNQLLELHKLYDAGYLRNGALILEDATKYIESNPKKEVKALVYDSRMFDIDIFVVFHSLKAIPPKLRATLASITIGGNTGQLFQDYRELEALGFPNAPGLFKAYKNAKSEFERGETHFFDYVETGL